MNQNDYTSHFVVKSDPAAVYAAIVAVRDWWGGEIEGDADRIGEEFTYRFKDLHASRQRVTELMPGRKVAWHVVDGAINFVADPSEWTGTDIVFDITPVAGGTEVRITHVGLVPQKECFDDCSQGWNYYFGGSLKSFIETSAVKQAS